MAYQFTNLLGELLILVLILLYLLIQRGFVFRLGVIWIVVVVVVTLATERQASHLIETLSIDHVPLLAKHGYQEHALRLLFMPLCCFNFELVGFHLSTVRM